MITAEPKQPLFYVFFSIEPEDERESAFSPGTFCDKT